MNSLVVRQEGPENPYYVSRPKHPSKSKEKESPDKAAGTEVPK